MKRPEISPKTQENYNREKYGGEWMKNWKYQEV